MLSMFTLSFSLLALCLFIHAAVFADDQSITACLAQNGGGNGDIDVWIACIQSAMPESDVGHHQSDPEKPPLLESQITTDTTVLEEREEEKEENEILKKTEDAQDGSGLMIMSVLLVFAPLLYVFKGGDEVSVRIHEPPEQVTSVCKPLGFALATVFHELLQGDVTEKLLEELLGCACKHVLLEALGDQAVEFTDMLVKSFSSHYRVMASVRHKHHQSRSKTRDFEAGEQPCKFSHDQPEHATEASSVPAGEAEAEKISASSDVQQSPAHGHDVDDNVVLGRCQSVFHVEERFEVDLRRAVVQSETDTLVHKMEQLSLGRGEHSDSNPLGSALHTFERSVAAQERSNYMKYLSLLQKEKQLTIKEEELSFMKRKMTLNTSRFTFKVSEVEDRAVAAGTLELCTKCADDFVAGLLVMGSYMAYCTWKNLPVWMSELRNTCMAESNQSSQKVSWHVFQWMYSAAEDKGRMWLCMMRGAGGLLAGAVLSMGVIMLVFRRLLSYPSQRMPFTIFLAGGCIAGFGGKFCIDLIGGNGQRWLIVWSLVCSLHAAANYFAVTLYKLLSRHYLPPLIFHLSLALFLPALAAFVAFSTPTLVM